MIEYENNVIGRTISEILMYLLLKPIFNLSTIRSLCLLDNKV